MVRELRNKLDKTHKNPHKPLWAQNREPLSGVPCFTSRSRSSARRLAPSAQGAGWQAGCCWLD